MKYLKFFVVVLIVVVAATSCSSQPRKVIPNVKSPANMTNKDAAAKNNEGVDHLVQGHWDVAEKYLRQALMVKRKFAEAHFNLGVALDGMGKHAEATESFRKAREFGADKPKITEAEILKKHLAM